MRTSIDTTDFWAGATVVGCFVLCGAAAIGWVLNVVKFFMALNEPLTMFEVVRAFSIIPFFFVGCIIGWL